MSGRLKRALKREEGQALVEFALVLPILLLVLLAIFDFGSAVNKWNDETSLANVGARYAAVGNLPSSTADPTCGSSSTISAYLQCQAQHVYQMPTTNGPYGFQGPISVMVCAPDGTAEGDPVQVNVTAQYKWLPGLSVVGGHGFGSVSLTGAATMMLENALPTSLLVSGTLSTGCQS